MPSIESYSLGQFSGSDAAIAFNATQDALTKHRLGRGLYGMYPCVVLGLPRSGSSDLELRAERSGAAAVYATLANAIDAALQQNRSTMTTTPATLEQAKAELAEIEGRLERQAQRSRERAARRNALIKRRNEVARLVEQLSIPAEPNAKHVEFKKQFHKGGRVYEYGAVKANGYWYVTGTSPQGVRWPQLVEFVRKDNVIDFYVGELCPPF